MKDKLESLNALKVSKNQKPKSQKILISKVSIKIKIKDPKSQKIRSSKMQNLKNSNFKKMQKSKI